MFVSSANLTMVLLGWTGEQSWVKPLWCASVQDEGGWSATSHREVLWSVAEEVQSPGAQWGSKVNLTPLIRVSSVVAELIIPALLSVQRWHQHVSHTEVMPRHCGGDGFYQTQNISVHGVLQLFPTLLRGSLPLFCVTSWVFGSRMTESRLPRPLQTTTSALWIHLHVDMLGTRPQACLLSLFKISFFPKTTASSFNV